MTSNELVLSALRAAISRSLLDWAVMLSTVGAWFYAMYAPDQYRLAAAIGITLGMYLPRLWLTYNRE